MPRVADPMVLSRCEAIGGIKDRVSFQHYRLRMARHAGVLLDDPAVKASILEVAKALLKRRLLSGDEIRAIVARHIPEVAECVRKNR